MGDFKDMSLTLTWHGGCRVPTGSGQPMYPLVWQFMAFSCGLGLCVRCCWCFVCALKILSHLTMVLGQDSALGELPSLAEQLLVQMGSSCAQLCCQLVVGNPVVWHQCPSSQLQC